MKPEQNDPDGGERASGVEQRDVTCPSCWSEGLEPREERATRWPDGAEIQRHLCPNCEIATWLEPRQGCTSGEDVDRGDGPRTDGGTDADGVERRGNLYTSDLLDPVVLGDGDHRTTARLRRGGVQKYDRRYVEVSGEGFSFRIPPSEVPEVIKALEAIRSVAASEDLRSPCCVHCGEEVDGAKDAERHYREQHEDSHVWSTYEPEWYYPDPNASISRMVEASPFAGIQVCENCGESFDSDRDVAFCSVKCCLESGDTQDTGVERSGGDR